MYVVFSSDGAFPCKLVIHAPPIPSEKQTFKLHCLWFPKRISNFNLSAFYFSSIHLKQEGNTCGEVNNQIKLDLIAVLSADLNIPGMRCWLSACPFHTVISPDSWKLLMILWTVNKSILKVFLIFLFRLNILKLFHYF